jgi:hypothetical protein
MDAINLVPQIRAAFHDRPYPGDDNLVDVDDLEGIDIRRDFKGRRWEEVPPGVIERNHDSLPLFTTEAFCYYLPAYLVYSLETADPTSNVPFFTLLSLMGLGPQRRAARRLMTPQEREAICAYLRSFAATAHEDDQDADDALEAVRLLWSDTCFEKLRARIARFFHRTAGAKRWRCLGGQVNAAVWHFSLATHGRHALRQLIPARSAAVLHDQTVSAGMTREAAG